MGKVTTMDGSRWMRAALMTKAPSVSVASSSSSVAAVVVVVALAASETAFRPLNMSIVLRALRRKLSRKRRVTSAAVNWPLDSSLPDDTVLDVVASALKRNQIDSNFNF